MDFRSIWPYINAILLFVLVGLGGAFYAYLKKIGENAATHKDMVKLTKEIEAIRAEIAEEVWNRQRRWDLKRDMLVDAFNKLSEMEETLKELDRAIQIPTRMINENWKNVEAEKYDEWQRRLADFRKASELAAVVCGLDVWNAFVQFANVAEAIADEIHNDNYLDTYKENRDELWQKHSDVCEQMRGQLGVEIAPEAAGETGPPPEKLKE
jgi:hypothetical protein